MIGIVKEICIFMIISQTILFFVPGTSYIKYVRVLVGIMMILRITELIFSLVADEEKQKEISSRVWRLEENIEAESEKLQTENGEAMLYESMEEELKKCLETCESDYEITDVRFSKEIYAGNEDGEKGELLIKVSEKSDGAGGEIRIGSIHLGEKEATESEKETELKKLYGKCIGVDADHIKIISEWR